MARNKSVVDYIISHCDIDQERINTAVDNMNNRGASLDDVDHYVYSAILDLVSDYCEENGCDYNRTLKRIDADEIIRAMYTDDYDSDMDYRDPEDEIVDDDDMMGFNPLDVLDDSDADYPNWGESYDDEYDGSGCGDEYDDMLDEAVIEIVDDDYLTESYSRFRPSPARKRNFVSLPAPRRRY